MDDKLAISGVKPGGVTGSDYDASTLAANETTLLGAVTLLQHRIAASVEQRSYTPEAEET
jgi:hypothetical protein